MQLFRSERSAHLFVCEHIRRVAGDGAASRLYLELDLNRLVYLLHGKRYSRQCSDQAALRRFMIPDPVSNVILDVFQRERNFKYTS